MRQLINILTLIVLGLGSVQAKTYFIHTDHLGTPQAMTDASQTVVWKADHTPFGEATVDEDPDGDGETVTMNLRFPGQYFDEETGLHYNGQRYYDPEVGRFITSDHIGLQAGTNTYLYANANPVTFFDPNGEAAMAGCAAGSLAGPIGCGVGTAVGIIGMMIIASQISGDTIQGSEEKECPPEDPCRQPDALYDLVDSNFRPVGIILYKDIPFGAITHPMRFTPNSCGSVSRDVMDKPPGGTAGGDITNLDHF